MTRFQWPDPPINEITAEFAEGDLESREIRVQHAAFLHAEFGPPPDMILIGGIPAMFAINELTQCFINGCYLATILTAQVFVEHTLGGDFRLAGDDKIVSGGLKKLIDESNRTHRITPVLAARLHDLRIMRNPYTHPKRLMGPGSYMSRLIEKDAPRPEALAEQDAREAIRIVVDFLREGSPSWRPGSAAEPENRSQ